MEHRSKRSEEKSIIQGLVVKAIRYGGDLLEVEYKNHYGEVFVMRNGIGFGIARFKSSSAQGAALRKELYGVAKKKRRIVVDKEEYELHSRIYDSFGEDAFRIHLQKL